MGSIEEKVDLESAKDQDIPFNSTQPTKKSQSFNFEANRVISPPSEVSFSSLLRKMHRISWLRSIYIVLIKAKINTLLPFGFIAIMLHHLTGKHGPVVFFLCLLGIIPVAERLGYVTEQLAISTGPTAGGLICAAFANAADIVSLISKNGMIRGIQQSLLGSILADMLLVLGCALFFGGLVHRQKEQRFSEVAAHMTSALSLMAFMGILFPSVLQFTHTQMHTLKSELALSRISSCIILIGYGSFLFFQIKSKPILYISVDEAKDNGEEDSDEEEPREITQWEAIGWVAILTCWMSVLSAYLGDRIQEVSDSMNMQVGYISVILIPSVRNASEHASAVMFAMKDKLDLTLGVAIGSSTQISMFVIPFFAVAGWIVGKPMDLNFHVFETTILLTTVLVVAFMLQDGKSNCFKGFILILCYLIIAASFFVHSDP